MVGFFNVSSPASLFKDHGILSLHFPNYIIIKNYSTKHEVLFRKIYKFLNLEIYDQKYFQILLKREDNLYIIYQLQILTTIFARYEQFSTDVA